MRRVLIILAIVCIGLGSVVAGYGIVNHMNPLLAISRVFVPTPQQVFGKNNLLVLVEGLDYDYTQTDQPFSSASRSDVIWAMNFDFTNHRIYELSVPRDMLATFPNGTQHKINQAQSDGGPKEAEQVIARFLGIPGFDRYAVLRINAAKEVIDAIGGVEVDVENSDCLTSPRTCKNGPINYDDTWGHLHIHLEPGWQHLDGAQAVGYMRFRHDWCSDPCRIMRQQQVAHALIAKLKGNKVSTLLHMGQLISIARANLQTNLTQNEMLSLATYYADVTSKDLITKELPYTGDVEMPDGDDLIPNRVAVAQMVRTMLVAPPTPIPSADPMALAAIPPRTLRVDVENGSGVRGAAHRIAGELRQAGFQIGDIGDYTSDSVRSTEIEEHSSVLFAGARVREALPERWHDVSIVPASATSAGSDVTIILGRDLARPE
ncbi:MAG: LCP family protein [Candidatus Tyrphobacter sp.]